MKTVKIQVVDRIAKYPPKTYSVEVDPTSPEFLWYGSAVEAFIKDNNHPPRRPNTRVSVYYSRFVARVVG